MSYELDHVFVCCAPGAPEAALLGGLGLREGSANTHPGQGTACRRFFFATFYLELLWVSDAAEAQSPLTAPTRLFERWTARAGAASPFGLVLRPGANPAATAPFSTWPYRPAYLPPGLSIDVAQATPLTEPALFYLGFQRGQARGASEPREHALPKSAVTSVALGLRARPPWSAPLTALQKLGLVALEATGTDVLEIGFDQERRGQRADLRPGLPLVLRW